MKRHLLSVAAGFGAAALITVPALAQERPTPPAQMNFERPPPSPADTLVSPVVNNDGSVTLSLFAPDAEKVVVGGTDMVNPMDPPALTKDEDGIWSVTLTPPPGTYRYAFNVDGLQVADPKNPLVSTTNTTVMSLVHIDGSPAEEDRLDVPHGTLAEVYYPSPLFGQKRRMHVYTPPGYETSNTEYPVLYLLHGAGDSDDSWGTVGRANFIMDNLIASGEAEPMIVVMPAGHWPDQGNNLASIMSDEPGSDPYTTDFVDAIVPYVEANYRTLDDAENRAIAGLSMGGAQTLTLVLTQPGMFEYAGVFSSGFFGDSGNAYSADQLEAASDLDLLYFAWGTEDFVTPYTEYSLALFDHFGVDIVKNETGGGHTWDNWRNYLHDYAPRLFD